MLFKKELENQEVLEGAEAVLSCETSRPDCRVTWLKGSTVLAHGDKYSMEQTASTHTLRVHKLHTKDGGDYTCDTGDRRSTASLTVKGNPAAIFDCDGYILTSQDTCGHGVASSMVRSPQSTCASSGSSTILW